MPGRRTGRQSRLGLTDKLFNGRVYKKSRTSEDGRIIYLRCSKQTICHGTAKLINGVIQELNPHSEFCIPDDTIEPVARFKEALAEALRLHYYKLKDLYDSLALVHPVGARRASYQSVRPFMVKCRMRHFPARPENIEDFVNTVTDPAHSRILESETGRLSVRLITDDDGDKHAVLYDENFVREEMQDVTKLLIDATFRSRPQIREVYQLMTIMGIKLNHGFPFVWVVMTKKTQVAYSAVLRFVKAHIIPHSEIILAMSDFEQALRNSVKGVFTTARSTGCNTHYDRTVYQKAKSLGLQDYLRTNDEAKHFFKKVLALAYLPAESIENQYRVMKSRLSATVRVRLRQLDIYYSRYWLRTVTPRGFSVYGLGRRTNNVIESYHSRLGHRLGSRPGVWDFICKLLRLQSDVRVDINHLRNNRQIGRHARYSTIFKQKELLKAWRDLHMLKITTDEFMEKAVSLKGNVDALIAQMRDTPQEYEYELQETPEVGPLEQDPDYEREIFAQEPPYWLVDNDGTRPVHTANDHADDDTASEHSILSPRSARDLLSDDEVVANEPPHSQAMLRDNDRRFTNNAGVAGVGLRASESSDDELSNAGIDTWNDDSVELNAIFIPDESPQSPPLSYIEDIPPSDNGAANEEQRSNNALVVQEERSQAPPLVNVARTTGKRRRQGRSNNSAPTASLEPGSEKNRKRNKRRKVMRKKAAARQYHVRITESARLREELVEAQRQLDSAANQLRTFQDDGLCRICFLSRATHTYLPCGHCCCCRECVNRLWDNVTDRRCPICRTQSTEAPRRIFQPAEC